MSRPGICFPSYFSNSGLWSNRSRWLGPPPQKTEIIALARGSFAGRLGNKSYSTGSKFGFGGDASNPSSASSEAKPSVEIPKAFWAKKWRRFLQKDSCIGGPVV